MSLINLNLDIVRLIFYTMKRILCACFLAFAIAILSCSESRSSNLRLNEEDESLSYVHQYRASNEMDSVVSIMQKVKSNFWETGDLEDNYIVDIMVDNNAITSYDDLKVYNSLRSLKIEDSENFLSSIMNDEQREIFDFLVFCAEDEELSDYELSKLFSMCDKLDTSDADFIRSTIYGLDIMLYSSKIVDEDTSHLKGFWGKVVCGTIGFGIGEVAGLTATSIAIVIGASAAVTGGVSLAVSAAVSIAYGAVAC